MFTRQRTMRFFKAALFLATIIFASCSNNLVQKKNAEFGVTITLPQASSTESVGRAADGTTWNIKALVEDADEKVLQTINRTGASGKTVTLNFDKVGVGEKVRVCVELTQEDQTVPSYAGKSNWFTTKIGENKVKVKLENVKSSDNTTFTITFDSNSGSEVAPQTVDSGKKATEPANPINPGKIFDGWYIDSECTSPFSFETPITSDITLYAKWREENQVASVKFNPSAGGIDCNKNVTLSCGTEGAAIYYKFDTSDNVTFNSDTLQNDGWFLWEDKGITIFSSEPTETSEIEATKKLFAVATCEDMKESSVTSATYNLNQYTVTFNAMGGTLNEYLSSPKTLYSGQSFDLSNLPPSRIGYTFGGWYYEDSYTNPVENSIVTVTNSDITVYANWTPEIYTITYNLNAEGDIIQPSNPNTTTYTIETETIVLQTPTRTGYAFIGWYTDENFINKITQIVKGSTGSITLYAQWKQNDGSEEAPFTTWAELATKLAAASNNSTETVEIYISGNLEATNSISLECPVKLVPTSATTITRGSTFTEAFFNSNTYDFEIAGTENAKITFAGNNINANAPFINANGTLALNYCNFENNINSSTDGGAVCLNLTDNTATATLNISNCNFEGNTVSATTAAGGAVALLGKNITSTIENCTFTNNTAENNGGGALYIEGTTVETYTHRLKNCTFTKNASKLYSSNSGGAIYLHRGKLILDGTTMQTNKHQYQDESAGGEIYKDSDIFVYKEYTYVILCNTNTIDCFVDNFGTSNGSGHGDNPSIKLDESFSTNSMINFLCVPTTGASVETGDILIAVDEGTELSSGQIACFQSITDEDGYTYTLNTDGTITKKTE